MLGMSIAALRHKDGLTQKQLANLLSVSPSAIGMYEQGRREPSAEQLVAAAHLFGVSTDYLLTGTPTSADQPVLSALYQQAEQASSPYTLRCPDGTEVPLDRQMVALLFSAATGEP